MAEAQLVHITSAPRAPAVETRGRRPFTHPGASGAPVELHDPLLNGENGVVLPHASPRARSPLREAVVAGFSCMHVIMEPTAGGEPMRRAVSLVVRVSLQKDPRSPSPHQGAPLTDDDVARLGRLVAVNLHTKALSVGVRLVAGRTASLLVGSLDDEGPGSRHAAHGRDHRHAGAADGSAKAESGHLSSVACAWLQTAFPQKTRALRVLGAGAAGALRAVQPTASMLLGGEDFQRAAGPRGLLAPAAAAQEPLARELCKTRHRCGSAVVGIITKN